MKGNLRNGRKKFLNHISNKRLISKIYKKLPQVNRKQGQKQKQPNFNKMGKGLEQIFPKDIQMANNYMKR